MNKWKKLYLYYFAILLFISPSLVSASHSIYISPTGNIGTTCTSAGDGGLTGAVYLSTSGDNGGLITSDPNTGYNPNITGCPTDYEFDFYNESTFKSALYLYHGDTQLWLMINLNSGGGNQFFTPVYIKDCGGNKIYTATNSCPSTPAPQASSGGIDSIFSVATSTFASTTGMQYSDVIGWVSSSTRIILGSGMSIFSAMLPWIIAIMVILATVGLIFRGFRFMKH